MPVSPDRSKECLIVKIRSLLYGVVVLLLACLLGTSSLCAGGDEIELRDGTVLYGDILTQNAQQFYLATEEEGVVRIDISKIRQIRFGPVIEETGTKQAEEQIK